jgi:hypothetical protein
MATEEQWSQDRERFAVEARRDAGGDPTSEGSSAVAAGASPLAQQFAELTRSLLDATTVAEVLERIISAALEAIPSTDVASITLRSPDGTFHTPIQTDLVARELDTVQYDSGRGPCVDSAAPAGPAMAHSADLESERRWPEFSVAATGHGLRSALATALLPDARPPQLSGALNLFSYRRGAFTAAEQDIALLLATHGSLALATTEATTLAALREAGLRRALDTRDVIGQAKGILMHRRGLTAEQAFDRLRVTSQQFNKKLVDIAAAIAQRHDRLD